MSLVHIGFDPTPLFPLSSDQWQRRGFHLEVLCQRRGQSDFYQYSGRQI